MPAPRLILIEGMVGAGKSTTAARLAAWLTSRGETARAFQECADNHPVRTAAVDRLRGEEPGGHDLAQWDTLAARCGSSGETVILEATLLQNSALPLFLEERPRAEIVRTVADVARRIAPAYPFLVHLRPGDIAAAADRVHAERGEPWSSRNRQAVTACGWARHRGLAGRAALIEIYRAWEAVVDELMATSGLAFLVIVDPQRDWDDTMRRIAAAVRAQPPP